MYYIYNIIKINFEVLSEQRKTTGNCDLKGSWDVLSNIYMRREFPSCSFICLLNFSIYSIPLYSGTLCFPLCSWCSHYCPLLLSWWQSGWQCLFFRKAHFVFLFIRESVRTFTLPLPLITYSPFLAYARCLSNIFICAWINTSTLSFHNACKQSKTFTLCLSTIIDFYFSSVSIRGKKQFQLLKKKKERNAYMFFFSFSFFLLLIANAVHCDLWNKIQVISHYGCTLWQNTVFHKSFEWLLDYTWRNTGRSISSCP